MHPRLTSSLAALSAAFSTALLAACFSASSGGSAPDASFDSGGIDGFGGPEGGEDQTSDQEASAADVTVDTYVFEAAADVTVDTYSFEVGVEAGAEAAVESGVEAGVETGAEAAVEAGADASPVDAAMEAAHDAAPPLEAGLTTGIVATGSAVAWPEGIVAIGPDVYWLDTSDPSMNQGTFQTCSPLAGNCGSPTLLPGLSFLPPNTELTTDGTSFFFPLGGVSIYSMVHLNKCPVAGCTSANITGLSNVGAWDDITGVAVDATNVYYGAGIPGGGTTYGIWIADKTGVAGAYTMTTGLTQTANLAVDANYVYFGLTAGGIYTCALAADAGPCTTPTLLQATTSTSGVAVDGTSLYWGDPVNGAVYRCPIGGCSLSVPTPIATGIGHVNGLAISGSYLLYTAGDSADGGAANGVFAALK